MGKKILKSEAALSVPKPDNAIGVDNKFASFARIVISIFMIFIMGVLTIASVLHTTGMEIVEEGQGSDTIVNRIREGLEVVVYYNDNVLGNLIWLAVCAIVCFLVMPYLKKIPLWAELAFIGVWTIILGSIWVNSSMTAPSEDSSMVTGAAMRFAENDFTLFDERYFKNYSFQLGYVFFNEIIIRIAKIFTEVDRLIFLQVINVIFLASAYIAIILINSRVFKDQRVRHMTVFLCTFSISPIIFCSFLYGIIPGLAFAVWALYFEIVYLQSNKIQYGIFSVLCIALAVMIKSNYNIALIAIIGIAVVMMFKRKKFVQDIIYILLAGVLSMSITPAVKSMYESRSSVDLGDAIPYVSWISMGLNESNLAPGWYNYGATVSNFEVNNFDADAAGDSSVENIKERLKYFRENPQYRNDFFYNKFVSQWNETSYQSIWNNKVRYQYEDKGAIAEWVCNDGEDGVKSYMDIYAQFIFAAVLIGVIACLRNKNFLSTALPLIILGGILYHMISEAKSQYAMPYFILMVGFAAYGVCVAYDFAAKKLSGKKFFSKLFEQSAEEAVPAAAAEVSVPDEKSEPEKDQ